MRFHDPTLSVDFGLNFPAHRHNEDEPSRPAGDGEIIPSITRFWQAENERWWGRTAGPSAPALPSPRRAVRKFHWPKAGKRQPGDRLPSPLGGEWIEDECERNGFLLVN